MVSEAISSADSHDMGTAGLAGRHVLDISVVRTLSHRSNVRGFVRFGSHLLLMGITGTVVWMAQPNWWLMIPAMVLHGFTIVTMFAPMHECVHRTAFANRTLNEVFGWVAGVLSFYNFTYYRHYHTWHHRYTQDAQRDPELMTPKPQSIWSYLLEISGITFWLWRPMTFLGLAVGRATRYQFVPADARWTIAMSAGAQLGIYVAGIVSIIMGYPYVWLYWFLPAILGQPLLRAILIAEHTGCSMGENGLTNTRTTLINPLVRLVMWNMSFHTEHHLYPSIPFHQLPSAHQQLREKLRHLSPNYVAANRTVIQSLGTVPSEE